LNTADLFGEAESRGIYLYPVVEGAGDFESGVLCEHGTEVMDAEEYCRYAKTGIGSIVWDFGSETLYSKYLEDCDNAEIKAILKSNNQLIIELAELKGFSRLHIALIERFSDFEEELIYSYPERFMNDYEAHDAEPEEEEYLEFEGKFYTKL